MVKPSTRVKEKFRNRFTSAKTAQQETNKIQELKEKIKELEAISENAQISTGKFLVRISKIKPSKQCRQTFTETVIQKRMRSLQQEGQLDPLVLVSVSNDNEEKQYQIEDGEVTWRAAIRLAKQGETKWKELEAVLSNSNDLDTIHFRTLLHHLHSESLNPLDRAESIIAEINLQLNLETNVAVKLLRNIIYRSGRDSKIADGIVNFSESAIKREYLEQELETSQIELIALLHRLQVELGSFVNNDLGMLALTEELKTAIREQELPCHQAKIINKLSAKTLSGTEETINKIRSEALNYVLNAKLSVDKTRSYINQIIAEHGKSKSTSDNKVKQNYQQLKTELQKLPISKLTKAQLNSLKSVMEKQLATINQKLNE